MLAGGGLEKILNQLQAKGMSDKAKETRRGPALAAVPFFEAAAARSLLDRLPSLDAAARATVDPTLLTMTSLCVLQERFRPQ